MAYKWICDYPECGKEAKYHGTRDIDRPEPGSVIPLEEMGTATELGARSGDACSMTHLRALLDPEFAEAEA
jgi:hypothetical protein